MQLKVKLDDGAYAPDRAHPTDGGLDLFTPRDVYVPARGSATVDTGVHVELPHGCAGILVSKSGLNVKSGILSTGLIDEGYDGSIVAKLYNHTDFSVKLEKGAKVTQLVVVPVLYCEVEVVDEIAAGPRGSSGFGSTDREES